MTKFIPVTVNLHAILTKLICSMLRFQMFSGYSGFVSGTVNT